MLCVYVRNTKLIIMNDHKPENERMVGQKNEQDTKIVRIYEIINSLHSES